MKIGILTFHAQINYGGILQCVALQEVLRRLGHDVRVIDRWMGPWRMELDGVFAHGVPFKIRVREVIRALCWWRGTMRQLRHLRTRTFFNARINCTGYHFYDWQDAPKDLGLDLIVCGSDQIWHCGVFGNPRPYLLEGTPLVKPNGDKIRAIAYAASFGFPRYPDGMLPVFKDGLKRFDSISVREAAGVKLVAEAGATATHVLDPTLLADRDFWPTLLSASAAEYSRNRDPNAIRRIVCYFISQDIEDAYPELESFARKHGCRIDVVSTQLRPHVNTKQKLVNYLKSLVGCYPHVHQCLASGPKEFLELFACADACVTDSFHALMFSVIFNLNCRILRPVKAEKMTQFSRFESFAENVEGDFIVANVDSALSSIVKARSHYKWEAIDRLRKDSIDWLVNAIGGGGK